MLKNRTYKNIVALFSLCKFKVIALIALSTLVGYSLTKSPLGNHIIITVAGMLLFTSGSAALNQYQEKDIDKLMERTKNRPLPADVFSRTTVIIIVVLLLFTGSFLLLIGSGFSGLLLSLLGLLWYNGFYTYLKKKTAFAIIPGSIIGAIPPLVGWLASGRNELSMEIIALCVFIIIWQIPHFWLIQLIYDSDYLAARIPVAGETFEKRQLTRILFSWINLVTISAIILWLYRVYSSPISYIILLILALWFSIGSINLLRQNVSRIYLLKTLKKVNAFALLVLLIICIDGLLS